MSLSNACTSCATKPKSFLPLFLDCISFSVSFPSSSLTILTSGRLFQVNSLGVKLFIKSIPYERSLMSVLSRASDKDVILVTAQRKVATDELPKVNSSSTLAADVSAS